MYKRITKRFQRVRFSEHSSTKSNSTEDAGQTRGVDEVEEVGIPAGGKVVRNDEAGGAYCGLVEMEGGCAVEWEAGVGGGAEVVGMVVDAFQPGE